MATATLTSIAQTNGVAKGAEASKKDLIALIKSLQAQVDILQAKQDVTDFLNLYSLRHDEACKRGSSKETQESWAELFHAQGVADYPFGVHRGREGMAEWAFGSVSFFTTCQLLSSNFHMEFNDTYDFVRVHTNIAAWWTVEGDHTKHFDEGGFYKWELVKTDEGWKIKNVKLTILWTAGDDPTHVGPR